MYLVVLCLFFVCSTTAGRVEIINGGTAIQGQFPWHVGVLGIHHDLEMVFCSGAIISENWVLTAAHCVNGSELVGVYSGTIDIGSLNRTEIIASEFIVHENFSLSSLMYNIAIIRLETSLIFDDVTKPILLDDQVLEARVNVTITGWGASNDDPTNITHMLQFAEVTTISNDDCLSIYGPQIVANQTVCAIGEDPLRNPCQNEGGAPLVLDAGLVEPKHVGIFSFMNGYGCTADYPAGYLRTASFRDWIKEKTGV